MELLKNSVAMQEQLLTSKGFLVIGYSLEKVRGVGCPYCVCPVGGDSVPTIELV